MKNTALRTFFFSLKVAIDHSLQRWTVDVYILRLNSIAEMLKAKLGAGNIFVQSVELQSEITFEKEYMETNVPLKVNYNHTTAL